MLKAFHFGSTIMPYEVELKARLTNPEKINRQAAKIGQFTGETFKEDVYFRRKGNTQRSPDDRYRLRREADTAVVTFKQKIMVEGVEVNDEVEFAVDEPHAFYCFADRFGFEPFVVKRKQSRVYQVGRANVELNKVEHLGHFAEIEILCDEEADIAAATLEVQQVLVRLGLKPDDLEPRRYIDLIQEAHPVNYRFVNDRQLAWPFIEVVI